LAWRPCSSTLDRRTDKQVLSPPSLPTRHSVAKRRGSGLHPPRSDLVPNGIVSSVSFVSTRTPRGAWRHRLAGIGADAVAVAGQLEKLCPPRRCHGPLLTLTADRPLKHRRVDEADLDACERVAARAVFDEHALELLPERSAARAGRRGSPWRSSTSAHRRDAAEGRVRQAASKGAFHGALLRLADAESGSCL